MKNKLYSILFAALGLLSMVMAQDPPSLPDAPDQGPITGIAWVAIAGAILFAFKVKKDNK